jgi:Holliday junction resolvase
LLDPETRRRIELWAEDQAVNYFTEQGWKVERVGSEKRGYDLECTRGDGQVLHVEVKGTQTRGEKVTLTGNEVKHNRNAAACGANHALYVVSEIKVSRDKGVQCSGGEINRILPWNIADKDLIETEYSYAVPKAPGR